MYNIRSLFKYTIIAAAVVLFFQFSSCKDEPVAPPIDQPKKDTITVSVEDISNRSVTINIKNTNYNSPQYVNLYRIVGPYQNVIARYPANVSDTSVYDDNAGLGLTMNSPYKYYAALTDSAGKIKDSSNTVEARTLDTTSHDYTWQEYGSQYWYGIWGLDENNVWVAGSKIMKWNGKEWISDESMGGQAIYGFSANDIWVAGGSVANYNGTDWVRKDYLLTSPITVLDSILFMYREYWSVWGTSSNNMYFGSSRGKVIHWNGNKARLTEVNSSLPILDIWGFSENDVYAVAGSVLDVNGELWHYDGISWNVIRRGGFEPNDDTRGPFSSVWGYHSNEVFLLADKVEIKRSTGWIQDYNPNVYMVRIRGSNSNNIFVCGHFGKLLHYNGMNWKEFDEFSSGILSDLFVTENKVFIAGSSAIYIGKKQ